MLNILKTKIKIKPLRKLRPVLRILEPHGGPEGYDLSFRHRDRIGSLPLGVPGYANAKPALQRPKEKIPLRPFISKTN